MDHYGYADALRDAVQSLSTKEAQDMLFDCLLSDTQKGELLIRALPTTPPRAVAESFARTMLSILRELSDRLREDAAKPTLAFFLPTNIDHYLKKLAEFSAQAAQRLPVGVLFPMLFAIEEEARRITTTAVLPHGADCHDPLFTSALKAMIGLSPTKRWQTAELIRAYVGTLHEERHRTLVLDSLNRRSLLPNPENMPSGYKKARISGLFFAQSPAKGNCSRKHPITCCSGLCRSRP